MSKKKQKKKPASPVLQEPLHRSELPPLPDGWTWRHDGDGEWMAVHKQLRVYKASSGLGFCESVSMTPRGSSERGIFAIPVRVVVAVAIANRIPHEPSSEPLADAWLWKRSHIVDGFVGDAQSGQTKLTGGERDPKDP